MHHAEQTVSIMIVELPCGAAGKMRKATSVVLHTIVYKAYHLGWVGFLLFRWHWQPKP